MAQELLHESAHALSGDAQDLHRALISLQEELEATDWYRQRAEACRDPELRELMLHNMREEMEHSAMLIEWLRRNNPDFSRQLDQYLFTEGTILAAEKAA